LSVSPVRPCGDRHLRHPWRTHAATRAPKDTNTRFQRDSRPRQAKAAFWEQVPIVAGVSRRELRALPMFWGCFQLDGSSLSLAQASLSNDSSVCQQSVSMFASFAMPRQTTPCCDILGDEKAGWRAGGRDVGHRRRCRISSLLRRLASLGNPHRVNITATRHALQRDTDAASA
jgi:hypothetical protein